MDGQQRLTSLYIGLKGTYAYKLKYRAYADEKQIVVRLEALREEINYNLRKRKPRFLLSLRTDRPFAEVLELYHEKMLNLREKKR